MSMKESSDDHEVVINIENCRVLAGDVMIMNTIDYCTTLGDDDKKSEGKMMRKEERRMSTSAKKPPRPPRGLSLDAADQKLIKEISEIIMMKRARIERMKKKSKAAAATKGNSSNSSTTGNLMAMLFTLVFCIVIIFQGGSWSSAGTNTNITSPNSAGKGDIVDAVGLAIQMNSSSSTSTSTSVHTFV